MQQITSFEDYKNLKSILNAAYAIGVTNVRKHREVFRKTLMASIRTATKNGRDDKCKELVCRLLASGMPIEEISAVLNIRAKEITLIQETMPR